MEETWCACPTVLQVWKLWSREELGYSRWKCMDFSSVPFSRSVVSDSLWPHGLQHTHGQAFLSITNSQSLPKLISIESVMLYNHRILCHPLLLPPSIFPSIRVFSSKLVIHIRWQSIGASALVSVIPMNIQFWFHLRLTGLISLLSKGLSRVFSSTTVGKHQFWGHFSMVQLLYPSIYDYWENYSFDYIYLYQQSGSNGSFQNRSMSD